MEKILNDTFKQIEDITDVHEMTNVQLKRLIKKNRSRQRWKCGYLPSIIR